jgi:uncharacterized protein (DUF2267 family)
MRMSLAEFLARVKEEAGLKGTSEAEGAARAVMTVCWAELGEGTVGHLISVLPSDFAVLMWVDCVPLTSKVAWLGRRGQHGGRNRDM